jgi:hypothetical protein
MLYSIVVIMQRHGKLLLINRHIAGTEANAEAVAGGVVDEKRAQGWAMLARDVYPVNNEVVLAAAAMTEEVA